MLHILYKEEKEPEKKTEEVNLSIVLAPMLAEEQQQIVQPPAEQC